MVIPNVLLVAPFLHTRSAIKNKLLSTPKAIVPQNNGSWSSNARISTRSLSGSIWLCFVALALWITSFPGLMVESHYEGIFIHPKNTRNANLTANFVQYVSGPICVIAPMRFTKSSATYVINYILAKLTDISARGSMNMFSLSRIRPCGSTLPNVTQA